MFLLLFGCQFSKVQETQACFMLSVPTMMPRLSVVDRGRAVGMLEAGMVARAIARQQQCPRNHNLLAKRTSDSKRDTWFASVTSLFKIVCEQRVKQHRVMRFFFGRVYIHIL